MTGREVASATWKTLLVVHRYLGVAVGLVMVLWCLSGFVMMYHGYPRLAEADRLKALEPVRLGAACDPARLGLASGVPVRGFSLEMAAGRPLLQLRLQGATAVVLDLSTCSGAVASSPSQAREAAERFARANGIVGRALDRGALAYDQWTLEGAGRRGPVQRFSFDDPAHTDVYVALRTGQVAQVATRADRVLGWLGAVPHWLYPTVLRQNGELWSQVVIWTSLIGVFLTATGLYVGIARFKPYKSGRWSPYRGWFYWHHIIGLVFGVLTLTWVGSGLLTMNPWGLLESPALTTWRHHLAGDFAADEVTLVLDAAGGQRPTAVVRYEATPLTGRLFVTATSADGRRTRLTSQLAPTPLTAAELKQALSARGEREPLQTLSRADAYYYTSYDTPAPLPVVRIALRDRESTRLYLDPVTGSVVRAIDTSERISRWTRTALHDFDLPVLRARPLWDAVVLFLLAGVTAACVTGAWLSMNRMARDIRAFNQRLRR